MSAIKVTVSGVGGSTTIEVDEDASVNDALSTAGIDAESVQAQVNGESDVQSLSDGDTIAATPREAKLG